MRARRVAGLLERVAAAAARRPRTVLCVVLALTLGGGLSALRLEPSAATDTLAARSSDAHQATERHRARFGDHAVVVLVRGPLEQLVLTDNLGRLLGLEGCLSGKRAPDGAVAGGERGPCAALARTKPVHVVYGPGTFINAAAGELQDQLVRRMRSGLAAARRAGAAARVVARRAGRPPAARERLARSAEQLVYAGFVRDLLRIEAAYGLGLTSPPRLDDPDFVARLVFDPARGAATPKARFAYLFPTSRSAAIQVRLRPNLPDAERRRAIGLIRAAVAMPRWRLRNAAGYTVTGVPVLADDLARELSGATLRLFLLGVVVMAVVLALVFRGPRRLVPLGVALAAVALTGGLMALLGVRLTLASVAVLPVLLGLAVDYAVQFQARVAEEGSVRRAARRAGPPIAVAALATSAGFLVLWLSPVPMVREFGALLVVGVVLAFALALTAGSAALAVRRRPTAASGAPPLNRLAAPLRAFARLAAPLHALARLVAAAVRGAGELLAAAVRPVRRAARRRRNGGIFAPAVRRPGRVLGVAVALAAAGWALDTQAPVESDLRALVPPELPAVRDLATLERTTGVAGEVDVVVEGRDLGDPAVVAWMVRYQRRVLRAAGYTARAGCGKAVLCPALSLPDLFGGDAGADRDRIRALLAAVPPYFSQAVISPDRRVATLAFGIKNVPLAEQHAVIGRMRAALDPPPGVRAELAGLPVVAAEANAALASPWRRMATLLAGLLAVGLVLLAVYRRVRRAWLPLVPIALATGWSALVLALLGVPLNPMSATLGTLVLAISTEFAVLLCARYEEERAGGYPPRAALARAYGSTGTAVLASGATVITGFAVLALSDVAMLRAFGLATVVDLSASLLGVLALLPAVLVLAERRAAPRPPAVAPAAAREVVAA
jgi:hydrophobe/amphiphile efflux-3 (HAE3) family protein